MPAKTKFSLVLIFALLSIPILPLSAAVKAKSFYVSAKTVSEDLPEKTTYFLTFKNEESATQVADCDSAQSIIRQILDSKGWVLSNDLKQAQILLEIETFTIDRETQQKVVKATVNLSNAGGGTLGHSGPSGQMSTEARIGSDGIPVIAGKGASHDETSEESMVFKVIPEKHLILRAYNLEARNDANEVPTFIVVDTVNREEHLHMKDCIRSLLQLACSYVGKQTDGYLVVNLKK